MKTVYSAIVFLIIACIFGLLVLFSITSLDYKSETNPFPEQHEAFDLIYVTSPRPNQEITSPLIIEGKARGTWFFEADFPVLLLDENGNILASGPATTDSEWMTEDFVPFHTELEFITPYTKKGLLILRKNNPSDLRENDKELKIPIVFKQETMTVKIFFCNSILNPEFLENKVFASQRQIPKTQAVARAALEELLKGITEEEKSKGFFTNINPGVKIQKLSIENGIARIDFNEQLEFQVAGSARVGAIRAQIIHTLKQFPTIDEVIISIDDRTEDILQP